MGDGSPIQQHQLASFRRRRTFDFYQRSLFKSNNVKPGFGRAELAAVCILVIIIIVIANTSEFQEEDCMRNACVCVFGAARSLEI